MLMHPELLLDLTRERRRELIAEADRERLLTIARMARRTRKAPRGRGQPAGTLRPCEPSVAVPAR